MNNKIKLFIIMITLIVVAVIYVSVLFPRAYGQIEPFEQQLESIRDPQECTRKVVQASSATIPFTLKVFYDTTRNAVLEIKQQGNTFPITQRTNQVMTFYTNGTDQYEIFMEMNYDEPKSRQIYVEYLSQGQITFSGQEKFEGTKFCMRIFANTVLPPRVPTKEEIFGDALDYIAQIPAMVTAFNANSITTATSISYMWMLILGMVVAVVIIFISSVSDKRKLKSMMKDGIDAVEVVNKSAENIEKLEKTALELVEAIGVKDELQKLPKTRKTISDFGRVQKKEEKKPRGKLFERFHRKQREIDDEDFGDEKQVIEKKEKDEDVDFVAFAKEIIEKNTIGDEILNELAKKEPEPELTTARIIEENIPIPIEQNADYLLKPIPPKLSEFLKLIDYKKQTFKEGMNTDKFSYKELNELYAWISHYRRHMNLLMKDIPRDMQKIQEISIDLLYHAIHDKLNRKLQDD